MTLWVSLIIQLWVINARCSCLLTKLGTWTGPRTLSVTNPDWTSHVVSDQPGLDRVMGMTASARNSTSSSLWSR